MNQPQLYSFEGRAPCIDPQAYVHPSAVVIGDVRIGPGCFVGPHATLRGDQGRIVLDEMSNVQDNCVLHTSPGGLLRLHRLAQVGHGAVLHGCTLMENSLVGINSTVLDGATVGCNAIVGAHSLVKRGAQLAGNAVYAGCPAQFVDSLSAERIEDLRRSALVYVARAQAYRRSLVPVQAADPGRLHGGPPAAALTSRWRLARAAMAGLASRSPSRALS
jgi:phenylacetic acid degradation protein